MPSSIISPFPVFNDLDGSPLENGYIYIGQSNLNPETAPVNVFWDAALSVPAAQPIRTIGGFLSRNGSPANVYITGDTYSITVRNSRRVFVYSDLNQSNLPTFSLPGDNVSFLQAGTGAITRTMQNKARESVSVLDFGADPTGGTDSTLQIQAAIDYAATQVHTANGLTLGIEVSIPSGTYLVSTLTVSQPITISGDGISSTRLIQRPEILTTIIDVSNVDHFELYAICIDGNRVPNSKNNGNGLSALNCRNVIVSECEFRYCGGNGFRTEGGERIAYSNCQFHHNFANGAYHKTQDASYNTDTGTKFIVGENSFAYNNGFDGFCYDTASAEVTLVGCVSYLNTGTGYTFFGWPNKVAQPRNAIFTSCISKSNYLDGFSINSAYNVILDACMSIEDGTSGETRSSGFWILNDMAGQEKMSNITITGCQIFKANGNGIYVDSVTVDYVTNVMIADTLIYSPCQAAYADDNFRNGIRLNKVDQAIISNCQIKDDDGNMKRAITSTSLTASIVVNGGKYQAGTVTDFDIASTDVSITCTKNGEYNIRNYFLDKGATITGNARPKLSIVPSDAAGATIGAVGRLYSREAGFYASGLTNNMKWNGNWVLDDTSFTGWDVSTDSQQNFFQIRSASAGANPRTVDTLFKVSQASDIADNETAGWLLVRISGVYTLKRVGVAGVDSAGAGFRLLRVPN